MIKNYFKIAWRNLLKGKMYSFINITGLSIGMVVALLIGLWIQDELSFNTSFDNHGRIAKVVQHVTNNGEVQTWNNVPFPLADELRKNYGSDFKHIVMAAGWGDHLLTINDKKLKTTGAYFEKEMPEMFSLKMLKGSRSTLNDPSSVLISASAARAYFDNADPVNKIIKIDNNPVVKVGGVYEDFPHNTDFAGLHFIAGWDNFYANNNGFKNMEDPWRPNFTTLFVQLNEHADFDKVSAKIKDAKLKKLNAQLQQKKPALFLQPMDRWHLYSEYNNGVNTGGAIRYVWMFGIIGVFVLLLACINFMNLSTASSEKRAKEVGIRKAIGSLRKQIISQFFAESFLTVVLAFICSLLLALGALPSFNILANKQMAIDWSSPFFWAVSAGFVIFTALAAGSYPAFYLSSFKPVKVLKGSFKAGRFAAVPRQVMVVLQFTVSVTLIIGTIVIYNQVQFAKNRPVGYSRANLISVPTEDSSIHTHFNAVKEALMQTGAVASLAESESPTTGIWNTTSGFTWPGKDPNLSTDFAVVAASHDYGNTIGWHIKAGRGFSKEYATDSSAVILNEAAVKYMNLQDPVGTTVTWWGKQLTVIGVIDNMIMGSPYEESKTTIYVLAEGQGSMALLKLNPAVGSHEALKMIAPVFKKFSPQQPFEYKFVDDEYAAKFSAEERIGKLAGFFALLAITISCLGLFGLTSFVAAQRKKEIGVRKVVGASVYSLWQLLSKDFVVLVGISCVIAVPVAYYFMQGWLEKYQYRTTISWWFFAVAIGGALLITVLTVSFQAIKAAIANPVKSLRTE